MVNTGRGCGAPPDDGGDPLHAVSVQDGDVFHQLTASLPTAVAPNHELCALTYSAFCLHDGQQAAPHQFASTLVGRLAGIKIVLHQT